MVVLVMVVQVMLVLVCILSRLLASDVLWLHWNEHLVLHRLGLINDLWYQMNDIAALIGGLTHESLSSSCHVKVWLLLLFFNNFDVGVQQLESVAFAMTERSGRCGGGQTLQRWTRWRFLGGARHDWLLDGH